MGWESDRRGGRRRSTWWATCFAIWVGFASGAVAAQSKEALKQESTPKAGTRAAPKAPATATPGVPPTAAPPAAPMLVAPPAPAAAPPIPNLAQQLADVDAGGLQESWSNTPSFVGDGCAPTSTSSTLPVGRLVVIAPGLLNVGGDLQGNTPAEISTITDSQFNSVQAIQAAGYPIFVLPAQPLGNVPGTPPTEIAVGGPSPGAGITPLQSPDSYTAAVDETFATDPTLDTSKYAAQNPQTVYDHAASGALPASTGTTGAQDAFLFYNYVVNIQTAALVPGINVGFTKLVENASPIPRDRVYFNYSYFHNANISAERADINRFTPGFEKTFFDQWTSIEVRTPFAGTLSNVQEVVGAGACGGVSEYRDVEFGNMSVIFKSFLWQEETWGISGGMQVLLPTAQSTFVRGTNQLGQPVQLVYVENQSVHTMPFIGSVWAPNERSFNQIMLQMDIDANGNPAYVNNNLQPGIGGKQLTSAGRIVMPTFMYLGFSTGYWLYQSRGPGLTGFSPVMEVHVNQGMYAFQQIKAGSYTLGDDRGTISVINGLVGCNFEWNRRSTVTLAYVTPFGGGFDRFFDGELRAFVNWRFGRQNRLTRAQF